MNMHQMYSGNNFLAHYVTSSTSLLAQCVQLWGGGARELTLVANSSKLANGLLLFTAF